MALSGNQEIRKLGQINGRNNVQGKIVGRNCIYKYSGDGG